MAVKTRWPLYQLLQDSTVIHVTEKRYNLHDHGAWCLHYRVFKNSHHKEANNFLFLLRKNLQVCSRLKEL